MANEEMKDELSDILNEATSSNTEPSENDSVSATDDETLEIRKEGLHSEKVVVTEQVESKFTEAVSKTGMSYGTAKSLLISIGIVFLAVSGYLFYTFYQSNTYNIENLSPDEHYIVETVDNPEEI